MPEHVSAQASIIFIPVFPSGRLLKKGKTYLPASREVVDRYVKYSILTFSLQCSGPGPLQGLHGPVVQAQEEDDRLLATLQEKLEYETLNSAEM